MKKSTDPKYILNEKTGRYVLKSGIVGKEILRNLPIVLTPEPEPEIKEQTFRLEQLPTDVLNNIVDFLGYLVDIRVNVALRNVKILLPVARPINVNIPFRLITGGSPRSKIINFEKANEILEKYPRINNNKIAYIYNQFFLISRLNKAQDKLLEPTGSAYMSFVLEYLKAVYPHTVFKTKGNTRAHSFKIIPPLMVNKDNNWILYIKDSEDRLHTINMEPEADNEFARNWINTFKNTKDISIDKFEQNFMNRVFSIKNRLEMIMFYKLKINYYFKYPPPESNKDWDDYYIRSYGEVYPNNIIL